MKYIKIALSALVFLGMIAGNVYAEEQQEEQQEEELSGAIGGAYGNEDGTNGKSINVSIKQRAKGAICPRAIKGSSVVKIACDHFEITSKYGSGDYKPAIKVGAYREMIQTNGASHQALVTTDPT